MLTLKGHGALCNSHSGAPASVQGSVLISQLESPAKDRFSHLSSFCTNYQRATNVNNLQQSLSARCLILTSLTWRNRDPQGAGMGAQDLIAAWHCKSGGSCSAGAARKTGAFAETSS